jgi:hypothetical protein
MISHKFSFFHTVPAREDWRENTGAESGVVGLPFPGVNKRGVVPGLAPVLGREDGAQGRTKST